MTPFSQEVFDAICDRIANGESLRTICTDENMPSQSAVFKWLASDKEKGGALVEQYARAREAQADALFDEILDIADDGRNDWVEKNDPDNPGYRENGEALRRSVLRVDARKWMAGKLRPKVYGEKIAVGGAEDMPPVRTEDGSLSKLADALNAIASRNAG